MLRLHETNDLSKFHKRAFPNILQAYSVSLPPLPDDSVKRFKTLILTNYVLKNMECDERTSDADLFNLLRVLFIEYPENPFEALN